MANVQYYDVILKPIVTEKSMAADGLKRNILSLFIQKQTNP